MACKPAERRVAGAFLSAAVVVLATCVGAVVGGILTSNADFAIAMVPLGAFLVALLSFAGFVIRLLSDIRDTLEDLNSGDSDDMARRS